MIQLHPNEKIILIVRKHWVVLLEHTAMAVLLAAVSLVLFPFARSLLASYAPLGADVEMWHVVISFFFVIYLMSLFAALFFALMDYYLDMWIITDKRIIDIEQRGLFSRETAEVPVSNVQDVTLDVHGILRTIFKFGTIKLQTAGMREFFIKDVPHLHRIKDEVLKYAHGQQQTKESRSKN